MIERAIDASSVAGGVDVAGLQICARGGEGGRPGTTRARAREHRAAAPDRGADAEPTPPATATGGPAAVVITLPHVAELASPHRDRAARHRGALASDGVASLLEMEESGRQTWSPSHRARTR